MQPTPEQLRQRLVEIDDEVRGLPADAFASKHELLTEADQLRALLGEALEDDLQAIGEEWAERAGRKGTHTVNEDEKIAQAGIPSPVDN